MIDDSVMKNLKDHTYYSELYDKITIEKCQRLEKSDGLKSLEHKDEAVAKIKKEFFDKCVAPTALYFIKGERHFDKDKTIQEWMERDRALDNKLENAHEPEGVQLVKASRARLQEVENEFEDVKKELEGDDDEPEELSY